MVKTIRYDLLQPFQAVNLLSDPGHIPGKVVIPNCAELKLVWINTSGKVCFNVCHVRYPGAFDGTVAKLDTLFGAMTTGANWTTVASHLAPTAQFAGLHMRDMGVVDAAEILTTAAGKPGTSTGTALPDEASIVITLKGAKAGPANRGRIYIPGLATTALAAGNVIAGAVVTGMTSWWTSTVRPAITSQGWTQTIANPARAAYTGSSGAQHPARSAGQVDVVQSTVQDNHWDTQRRRGLR